MKTGDKVAIFGTLVGIENINATVVVDGPNGVKLTLKVFPECLELAADQRITVPEYVKDDLDKASQSATDAMDIVSIYMTNGELFSEETCLWIDDHCDEFINALVYEYKAEPVKKYNVIAWRDPRGKCETRYWCHFGESDAYTDLCNSKDANQQWTLDKIKQYGLEDCERVEVVDA